MPTHSTLIVAAPEIYKISIEHQILNPGAKWPLFICNPMCYHR